MDLEFWVAVWAVAVATILVSRWKWKAAGSGLVLAYIVSLWLIHWPAAVAYLFPWYGNHDPNVVRLGFVQSAYAIVSFGLGSTLVAPLVMRLFRFPPRDITQRIPEPKLSRMYIGVGLFSYLVLLPVAGVIPTATALVSSGWHLIVVGLCLGCWHVWQQRKQRRFGGWLLAALALPFLTTVTEGFLGYGTVGLMLVLTFVATFYRPRWRLLAVGSLLGYLAFSVYVSYMRDRREIREVVWGGASLLDRVDRVSDTVRNLEWLNPYDSTHLFRIDERLNQNYLVGTAVQYIDSGFSDFARGETLWLALAGLVPRALWPNKPVSGGSGNLVTRFTGIEFMEGTSVGVGQVLEFYINFGTVGVVVGFACLGIIITFFDAAAWAYLINGDWQTFTLWYLPAIGLLQAGGSLIEVTSSTGAGVATAILVNRYLLPRFRGRRALAGSTPGRPPSGLRQQPRTGTSADRRGPA